MAQVLKKKHTSLRSSKRDERAKKHKRKRSPSPSSSSSVFFRLFFFSAEKFSQEKSRNCSRSLSSADENPHDPAPRTECPALPRDHISLYVDDDDELNSHSEDHQDLALEDETHNVSEIHSNVSSEDMRFQNLIEEVNSFFFWPTSSQRKQMRFWEGTG